jgi:hypothetical protein
VTPRELRLRERIDQLTDERDQARARLEIRHLRRRRGNRRCHYCGDFSGLSLACGSHRDLLGLDPYYADGRAVGRMAA